MAEYKRIVSYIYNYEQNVKKNNVGYARVESGRGPCKITIHMNVMTMNEVTLDVCFFFRQKSEIRCIPLGKMVPRNGAGDFRIQTNADNVMDSGYQLEDMAGMAVYLSVDKYFATQWDDGPLRIKEWVAASPKTEEIVLEAAELKRTEREPEVVVLTENAGKEAVVSAAQVLEEERAQVFPDIEIPEEALSEMEPPHEGIQEELAQLAQKEEDQAVARQEARNAGQSAEQKKNENRNFEVERMMKIFNSYPKMSPFEDNEMEGCVRIELQDIGVFPMECWELANNSFLLHGYYSYRHLIFAKRKWNGNEQCVVGVPGIFYNREQFISGMFGFENFKSIKKTDQLAGEFGYWLHTIL